MLMRKWKPPHIPALEDWAVVSYNMVAINFYQVESEDTLEHSLSLGYGLEGGNCGNLTVLQKLGKCMASDNTFS